MAELSAIDLVRAILEENDAVEALVSTRIWPIEQAQNTAVPSLVLTLVSEEDGRHLNGSNQYPLAAIIVDALGGSYSQANTLGAAVKAALRDFCGEVDGHQVDHIGLTPIDHFDKGESGTLWRRRMGFEIRYRVSA